MNLIHRSIWNDQTGTFVAVSEHTRSAGKKISSCTSAAGGDANSKLKILAVSLMLACGAGAQAQPIGGVVSAGSATIGGTAGNMTITQTTPNVAINWQSFGIQAGQSVQFVQPGSSSVALNRVIGSDPSNILGSLSANGKVFLVNPNGILFGRGASVNVAGLVATTMNIADANFMARNYQFSGAGTGAVLNQGTINAADGGYVALLGANVSNQGVISAKLGTVALAAGKVVTLDVAGDKLLNVAVDQGAVNALVENGGLIKADGGRVLMTTQAAGSLLSNAVNNTGLIQAQTLENVNGTIMLMGGMENGTVSVAGTLDASAPNGGNGGFIETSAANMKIANDVKVTTAAARGTTGNWLIDPVDFTIAVLGGDITGTALATALTTNNITIQTATGSNTATEKFGTVGNNGDIFVNGAVDWTSSGSTGTATTLTLNAFRDVNVNAAITATQGNLVVCCGRDVNVNAAINTTDGSVLLNAGRNVNVTAAMTTVRGNITMCAANDINVSNAAAITLTNGSRFPAQSLGLARGLVMSAGYGGTGPGAAGGTVVLTSPPNSITVTGVDASDAPVNIYYNPISYTAPTDYFGTGKFTLTNTLLSQHMLVFPDGGNKTFDGTTAATLSGLKGNPAGVTLVGPGTATFDTAAVGNGKTIIFSGFSLGGANAGDFSLPISCCAPVVSRTTANVAPEATIPPPAGTPPANPPPAGPPPAGTGAAPVAIPLLPVIQPVPPAAFPSGPVPPNVVALVVVPPAEMPPTVLSVVSPPETPTVAPLSTPAIVPAVTPPKPYVPPVRVPKQDRN